MNKRSKLVPRTIIYIDLLTLIFKRDEEIF